MNILLELKVLGLFSLNFFLSLLLEQINNFNTQKYFKF